MATRKVILITARTHPGETNGSFVVEGLIQFLCSEDSLAIQMRKRFIFKIIPMVNPDGVILGNYRCDVNGKIYRLIGRLRCKQAFFPPQP